jgi:hypothetical protein
MRFPFLLDQSFLSQRSLRRSSTILALAVVLMPTAWAQPKFKILHTVPGGLFSGLTFDAKGNLYGVTRGRRRSQRWHHLRVDARREKVAWRLLSRVYSRMMSVNGPTLSQRMREGWGTRCFVGDEARAISPIFHAARMNRCSFTATAPSNIAGRRRIRIPDSFLVLT